jgi:hypothetical protein
MQKPPKLHMISKTSEPQEWCSLLQAEQEFETNMVSAKVLEEAKKRSQSDEQIEHAYVVLRYRQLWRQSSDQHQKIRGHLQRQKKTEISLGAVPHVPRSQRSTSMGKKLIYSLMTLVIVGGLAWVGYVLLLND